MGGATRFITLLTAPFPPFLRLRGARLCTLTSNLSVPSKIKSLNPRLVYSFHSQPKNNVYDVQSAGAGSPQLHDHPWPEWTNFLSILSSGKAWSAPAPNPGDGKILPDDEFVEYEELSDDFVLAASTCLAFARARSNLLELLSRRDIEAVVTNGTPFLFKSALECLRRMRAFLENNGSNVSDFDRATTVDLMKYLLSYASNPSRASGKSGLYSRELVDSSVRHLLNELGSMSSAATGYTPTSEYQVPGGYRQAPRPLGRNVEMKRGDWVCSKCNFMNFARNMKCLECEEFRPKRQLTGGEWECPQCSFFNYGKNSICLRCECRRPGAPSFNAINSGSVPAYNVNYSSKPNFGNPKNLNSTFDCSTSQSVNNNFGRSSSVSERDALSITGEQNTEARFSSSISKSGSQKSRYPPETNAKKFSFVPLPADMFAKKDEILETGNEKELPTKPQETLSSEIRDQANVSSEPHSLDRNFQFLKNSSSKADSRGQEMEQNEKSESWFKKVVELHDAEDLSSEISNEELPDIMPIRKGENRFVVNKKKDRSLSSPKYRRQASMDQGTNTNFVPFVPFPPGYFARKETEQPNESFSPERDTSITSSSKTMAESENYVSPEHIKNGPSTGPSKYMESLSSENLESSRKVVVSESTMTTGNDHLTRGGSSQFSTQNLNAARNSSARSDEYSGQHNMQIANAGASPQVSENKSSQISWTGRSLEGSAVKEPNPLDMSEEAKAERWFKRVAQIKDISELSQIPDEDFPSIMPMRKGVNRFVVSKRKTPLERRLTSQQYRRNLPVVSMDPVKKDSDNN